MGKALEKILTAFREKFPRTITFRPSVSPYYLIKKKGSDLKGGQIITSGEVATDLKL